MAEQFARTISEVRSLGRGLTKRTTATLFVVLRLSRAVAAVTMVSFS